MEETLRDFFAAINRNDVDAALACCAEEVSGTYSDPGRNWKGKERGRVVMKAIFGMMAREEKKATYKLDATLDSHRRIVTTECWGDPNRMITTSYNFTNDNKILSMEPMTVTRLAFD